MRPLRGANGVLRSFRFSSAAVIVVILRCRRESVPDGAFSGGALPSSLCRGNYAYATLRSSVVQNAQRVAAAGTLLRHSGHSRTVSSTGSSVLRRAIRAFTGLTTRK